MRTRESSGASASPFGTADQQAALARSASAPEGVTGRTSDALARLRRRRRTGRYKVERVPFADLDGWSFQESTGNLVHHSGRFFAVEGMRVAVRTPGRRRSWHQPVINQPETGILGILAKKFDGVLHFLMQAKMEPGNPHLVQLSPTLQATRSNYTRVHGGTTVKYLDYFTRPGERERVLADGLQSEHGAWFRGKFNRNMVVETTGEVQPHDGFEWLTLRQISELLCADHVVNMDARTVLSCLPVRPGTGRPLHPVGELLSWITAERSLQEVRAQTVPLAGLPDWTMGPWSIDHRHSRYFRVVAVAAEAADREVPSWSQPLVEPLSTGIVAFLTRTFDGTPHVLVRARAEGGLRDQVEFGPTVQCTPNNYVHLPASEQPPFLATVSSAPPERIRYQALHSEEGGRFLDSQARYLLVEADERMAPKAAPSGFRWISIAQLGFLVRHGHYVSVQARTLLACLRATAEAA
ncbi:NDP-hexose 2,3-dehydratase family protein [Streptomyces celluloflavus]|uniref:NDP-hexose 2,3-dehydratase family protein n=1 Tax=Streptomyces celluloflavus TaxID=58344 RepID=UPI00365A771C